MFCVAVGAEKLPMDAWEPETPPKNIMLAWPWNTVAKRNILVDLIELCVQVTEDKGGYAGNLDKYLMDFLTKRNIDLNMLLYLESLPIQTM
jgi:hypothetical protein